MIKNYSIFQKLFLLCLIAITHTQITLDLQTYCLNVSPVLNPVCYNGVRYWNLQTAQCKTNQTLQAQLCQSVKYQKTVIQSGHECNCPLIQKTTCITKKGQGIFLNPCFAHCAFTNTGYGDYKNCPDNKTLWGNSIAVATSINYKNDLVCNCPTQYQPICVYGVQYTNACFAQCYRPNQVTSTCPTRFNYLTVSTNQNNCVCIHTVNPVCADGKRYGNACLANCDYPNRTNYPC